MCERYQKLLRQTNSVWIASSPNLPLPLAFFVLERIWVAKCLPASPIALHLIWREAKGGDVGSN